MYKRLQQKEAFQLVESFKAIALHQQEKILLETRDIQDKLRLQSLQTTTNNQSNTTNDKFVMESETRIISGTSYLKVFADGMDPAGANGYWFQSMFGRAWVSYQSEISTHKTTNLIVSTNRAVEASWEIPILRIRANVRMALQSGGGSYFGGLVPTWAFRNIVAEDTPILLAAKKGKADDIIKVLVRRKGGVNDQTRKGYTPLMVSLFINPYRIT